MFTSFLLFKCLRWFPLLLGYCSGGAPFHAQPTLPRIASKMGITALPKTFPLKSSARKTRLWATRRAKHGAPVWVMPQRARPNAPAGKYGGGCQNESDEPSS